MTVTGYEDGETQTETDPALPARTDNENNGALQLSCLIFQRSQLGNIQSCNRILPQYRTINLHWNISRILRANINFEIKTDSFLTFIDIFSFLEQRDADKYPPARG